MLNAGNPIGVMDSGIGGLTVVRELQRILPGEDIIYFGDSANCPYGNKTSKTVSSVPPSPAIPFPPSPTACAPALIIRSSASWKKRRNTSCASTFRASA